MRHLFLINPHAGKYDRTQEMREKLRTALAGRDEPWEAAVTQYPGHGAELADDTLRDHALLLGFLRRRDGEGAEHAMAVHMLHSLAVMGLRG